MKRRASIAILICLSLIATACDKNKIVSNGERVVRVASQILPILKANGINTQKAEQFKEYASLGLAAIKADDGTALGHIASTIDVLESLAADVRLIPDQGKRTAILAILAIANEALHIIADELPEATVGRTRNPSRTINDLATVGEFKAKPKWRCRDAKGRFAKMEVCKANPATTTVETY